MKALVCMHCAEKNAFRKHCTSLGNSKTICRFAGLTKTNYWLLSSKYTANWIPRSLLWQALTSSSPSLPFRWDALTTPQQITGQLGNWITISLATQNSLLSSSFLGFWIGPVTTHTFPHRRTWQQPFWCPPAWTYLWGQVRSCRLLEPSCRACDCSIYTFLSSTQRCYHPKILVCKCFIISSEHFIVLVFIAVFGLVHPPVHFKLFFVWSTINRIFLTSISICTLNVPCLLLL